MERLLRATNIYGHTHGRAVVPREVLACPLFCWNCPPLYGTKFHTYKYMKASSTLVITLLKVIVKGGREVCFAEV